MEDRFKEISSDYGELFHEVFQEQGLNYEKLEKSVFETVKKHEPKFKEKTILEIGIGDGETIKFFVEAGCKKLTSIDLNKNMLIAVKNKFGNKVKTIQMDAVKMNRFNPEQFEIIITALCIHNISKEQRKILWGELLRLKPKIFVAAEKIADPNPINHKEYYNKEIKAVIKVYKEKYHLEEVAKAWLKHYEYDEQEKLTLDEINQALGQDYDIELIAEMGMCKTIAAIRKN